MLVLLSLFEGIPLVTDGLPAHGKVKREIFPFDDITMCWMEIDVYGW